MFLRKRDKIDRGWGDELQRWGRKKRKRERGEGEREEGENETSKCLQLN